MSNFHRERCRVTIFDIIITSIDNDSHTSIFISQNAFVIMSISAIAVVREKDQKKEGK